MAAERASKKPTKLVVWISIICGFYHFLVVGGILQRMGVYLSPLTHRYISLLFAVVLLILILPMWKKADKKPGVAWYDVLIALIAVVPLGFVIIFQEQVLDYGQMGTLDLKGTIMAFVLMFILLECARRASDGFILPGLLLAVVLVTMFGQYMPGILHSGGFSAKELGVILYIGPMGFFGTPLKVATTIIIMFVVFSQVLLEIGGSQWFIKLALCLVGRMRGGAAKASVLASALFGTISGSPSSNAAAIGTITIPLMKKSGYSSEFAAGVEAVASTGGQILPPVMGAVAFVMADWLGMRYIDICLAAAVPAILYFAVTFYAVDIEARKRNLSGIAADEIPPFFQVLKAGWYYILPLAVLLYFLIGLSFPAEMSAFLSIVSIFVLSVFINRDSKKLELPRSVSEVSIRLKRVVLSVGSGVRMWVRIAVICAAVGIIVGCLTQSGISLKAASSIIGVAQGNLLIVLILTAVAAYVLGMGMDTLPLYITLTILVAPALVNMGVAPIGAHLYVLFWGLTSFFTPPVCLAVFVTSSIAQSGIWRTGFQAMRLGVALFIIPFAFVYLPAIILPAPIGDFAVALLRTFFACLGVIAGLTGFFFKRSNWLTRGLLFAGGCMLLFPSGIIAIIGAGIVVFVSIWQWLTRKGVVRIEAGTSTGGEKN